MIVLYDHEEIGSVSNQGAQSTITRDAIDRIFYQFPDTKLTGDQLLLKSQEALKIAIK